jgi:hypothetical protein
MKPPNRRLKEARERLSWSQARVIACLQWVEDASTSRARSFLKRASTAATGIARTATTCGAIESAGPITFHPSRRAARAALG